MFKLIAELGQNEYQSSRVTELLDSIFQPEVLQNASIDFDNKTYSPDQFQEVWWRSCSSPLPRKKHEMLRFLSSVSANYHYANLTGRVCQKYVWPQFFTSFPNGKILLVQFASEWLTEIWRGERELSDRMHFEPRDRLSTPQDASGISAENLLYNLLPLLAYGIYPLIMCDYVFVWVDLLLIYVPDRAFAHSQVGASSPYSDILWHLHHIFDDQWTFDSHRGPKTAALASDLKPTKNLSYFAWIIDLISLRMGDVLKISDVLKREQICMTFSRAVADCVMCVTSQFPYSAKVFYFACIDKLCNLLSQVGLFRNEYEAWQVITRVTFTRGPLSDFLRTAPGAAGNHLLYVTENASMEMESSKVTPEALRAIRNSHHGYMLKEESVQRLFKSSGEFNNDITLLVTPLLLYVLAQKWQ